MAEYDFIEWLLNQVDNPLFSYELQPVSVLVWRDRFSRIIHGNNEFRALSMPLTLGGSGRGKLTMDINDSEGKILLTDFPEDMDDAKYIYIKAMEKGALASSSGIGTPVLLGGLWSRQRLTIPGIGHRRPSCLRSPCQRRSAMS